MDIVQFAVGYVDKAWNVAAQVEECVHLHRCLGRPEMGPWKHRETQIDGRRVERINSAGQIHIQIVAGIQPLGLRDQPLGKLCVDPEDDAAPARSLPRAIAGGGTVAPAAASLIPRIERS